MENFSILLGIPATLFASAIYTGIILAIFTKWPVVKKPAVILSLAGFALILLEIICPMIFMIFGLQETLRLPLFYGVICFLSIFSPHLLSPI